VLIQSGNKEVVPQYLGFLRGVVDTEDLPLNISRETLQENLLVRKIATTLTKHVLSMLEKMAAEDAESTPRSGRPTARSSSSATPITPTGSSSPNSCASTPRTTRTRPA
jgi:hypothetical protein